MNAGGGEAVTVANVATAHRRNSGPSRYVEAWSWGSVTDDFVGWHVTERPLLNVCAGAGGFGDTTVDLYEPADVQASWISLPFEDDSYGAVFADPPWNSGYKADVAAFMREALRIAPVAYLLAPWIYGAGWARMTRCWVRVAAGVNAPIILSRYERAATNLSLFAGDGP
jgi:hypothetical protein